MQRIKSLLLLFVATMISLLIVQGATLLTVFNVVHDSSEHEHKVTDVLVDELKTAKYQVVQVQQYLTDSSATGEQDGIDDAAKSLTAAQSSLQQLVKIDSSLAAEVNKLQASLLTLHQTGLNMVRAYKDNREAGNAIMKGDNGFDQQSEIVQANIDGLSRHIDQLQTQATTQVQQNIEFGRWLNLALIVTLIILVLCGGWLLHWKMISLLGGEPVDGKQLAQELATGDLTTPLEIKSNATESLFGHLLRMRSSWVEMIIGLHGQANMVTENALQVSDQSRTLAAGSVQQSQASTEIARNIEELVVSINDIAEQSNHSCHQVEQTGKAAIATTEALGQVTKEIQSVAKTVTSSAEQVGALQAQMSEINNIVSIIHEIADQTNLLALNAAIEAARAGEQGRGFAVVADEVRKLAERTSGSTASISTMISSVSNSTQSIVTTIHGSVDRVSSGVDLIQMAEMRMNEVLESSNRSRNDMAQVQSTLDIVRNSANSIADQVTSISALSQSNSDTARNLSNASDNMQKIAESLRLETANFKIDNHKSSNRSFAYR